MARRGSQVAIRNGSGASALVTSRTLSDRYFAVVADCSSDMMSQTLDALFRPRAVVFVSGRNLMSALSFHDDLGFDGQTCVVNT